MNKAFSQTISLTAFDVSSVVVPRTMEEAVRLPFRRGSENESG